MSRNCAPEEGAEISLPGQWRKAATGETLCSMRIFLAGEEEDVESPAAGRGTVKVSPSNSLKRKFPTHRKGNSSCFHLLTLSYVNEELYCFCVHFSPS